MNWGKEFIFKKLVMCILALLFTALSAVAAHNSLTGIDVKQTEHDGYNVILKLAGNAHIKKTISSDDTLTILLNSTLPSEAMDIIYDNTSNINNVIVQKKNSDNTMIILEGKNISNANIFTKDITNGTLTPLNEETLFLSIAEKTSVFSIAALFLFILAISKRKNRKNSSLKIKNQVQGNITNKIQHAKTTPSIAYNVSKGYVSAPKDFIINRYMKEEKIRKAG